MTERFSSERTGKRLWHYQTLHHDLWDHDLPCPPVLCTVKREGKTLEAVAQPTKTGFVFLFERLTGKPLFPIEERSALSSDIAGEQAFATQPYPLKPPPIARQAFKEDEATDISPEARGTAAAATRPLATDGGEKPLCNTVDHDPGWSPSSPLAHAIRGRGGGSRRETTAPAAVL